MAETPPPFQPHASQAPQQKSGNPIVWILVALGAACCVCIIAGAFAGITALNQGAAYAQCPLTMGFANNALREYVKENGVFPPAETWQDEIGPFYKKQYDEFQQSTKELGPLQNMFRIAPPGEVLVCYNDASNPTGIYYNSELAGKKPEDFENADQEITLFESQGTALNSNSPYSDNDSKSEQKIFGEVRDYYNVTYGDVMDTSDFE